MPEKRPCQPAELAAVYVLLASSDCSYMSGLTVQATGDGRLAEYLSTTIGKFGLEFTSTDGGWCKHLQCS